jgi:hypothetical protein
MIGSFNAADCAPFIHTNQTHTLIHLSFLKGNPIPSNEIAYSFFCVIGEICN